MIVNEKREDPFTYEANAIAEGTRSGNHNFVQNRSETPESAKSGLRSTARVQHPSDYRKNEELELQNVEIYKLDPEDDYRSVEQVE
jgi:hypothetical protein